MNDDAAIYRKLQEPFPSAMAADKALAGFYAELKELRAKYKIPDVYCIVRGIAITESGEEGVFVVTTHNGDQMHAESMAAYALGYEQQRRQEMIATMLGRNSIKGGGYSGSAGA